MRALRASSFPSGQSTEVPALLGLKADVTEQPALRERRGAAGREEAGAGRGAHGARSSLTEQLLLLGEAFSGLWMWNEKK